ncbi:MAG: TatD family hydrolase [Kiritimatiellia bacterium]
MELFDTHAHFTASGEEIAGLLVRARDNAVARVMAVGGSEELNAGALRAVEAAKSIDGIVVCAALGWDRDQAGRDAGDLPVLDYRHIAAVGEIGLDYHYEGAARSTQIDLMLRQLARAGELNLPVVVHTRDADDDTLGALREIPSKGIIHSFTGSTRFCGRLLDLGFHISLSGIVTFRTAENVRKLADYIPGERLLIETDSPYLAPVPMRGRANEPAFLRHTAEFLAAYKAMRLEDLAARTTANARRLLGI